MKKNIIKNEQIIPGAENRPILFDFRYTDDAKLMPLIVFSHGFKGFKDWGHFNLIADYFAQEGFIFVKLNFSHNGTTPSDPLNFADLEAFGNNNFSKELYDLEQVINWCVENINSADKNNIYLMGHSRGGGISILKAAEDTRIKKVVSLAGPSTFERYPPEQINEWKKRGVLYVENSRTGQKMPLYYQLAENFYANKDRLSIEKALKKIHIPILIIHGDADDVVYVKEAYEIKNHCPEVQLEIINGGDHTFGACHPCNEKRFPEHCQTALEKALAFLKSEPNIKAKS